MANMRVWNIMNRLLQRGQAWIIVLMAVLGLMAGACPPDVQYATSQCLVDYDVHVAALEDDQGQINFYTGIDAENIRSICRSLSKSMGCVLQVQKSCPDSEHSKILTVVDGPLVNVAKLCHYDNLYELYSRHQYCYDRAKAESKACYHDFLRDTETFPSNIQAANHHIVHSYCRHLDLMVNCVSNNFRTNCGVESEQITDVLVKSSVNYSNLCDAFEEAEARAASTTVASKTTIGSVHDSRIGPKSNSQRIRLNIEYTILSLLSLVVCMFAL